VGYLRRWSRFHAIREAFRAARERFGLRIVHFSVQGNHLHLLAEAEGPSSLAQGIQGLAVRLARALNRVAGRSGKVFSDRYHAHVLRSRREVANALRYVLENFRHHLRPDIAPLGVDPCSSAVWLVLPLPPDAPVVRPRTWLLRTPPQGVLG
jgi:REP element-mobilizing transposase RayT